MQTLSRRVFLRLFPTVLGSAMLAGNKPEVLAARGKRLSPNAPSTLTPGSFAETLFVNGRVVTMYAADTVVQAVVIKDLGVVLGFTPTLIRHGGDSCRYLFDDT